MREVQDFARRPFDRYPSRSNYPWRKSIPLTQASGAGVFLHHEPHLLFLSFPLRVPRDLLSFSFSNFFFKINITA